jgi:hypothetical protein
LGPVKVKEACHTRNCLIFLCYCINGLHLATIWDFKLSTNIADNQTFDSGAVDKRNSKARPLLYQCLLKEPFVGPLLGAHNLRVFEPEVRAQWSHPCALALPYNAHRDDEENGDWQFTADDARIKLSCLYPTLDG